MVTSESQSPPTIKQRFHETIPDEEVEEENFSSVGPNEHLVEHGNEETDIQYGCPSQYDINVYV